MTRPTPEHEPQDAAVSAAFRGLDTPEPPPALDAAILAAARAAVAEAQPSSAEVVAFPRRRREPRRWLALAATLVLAVGVSWQLRDSADHGLPAPAPATAPVEQEAPAALATPPAAEAEQRAAKPAAPAPARRAESAAAPAPRAEPQAAAKAVAPVSPPPAPAPAAPAAPPLAAPAAAPPGAAEANADAAAPAAKALAPAIASQRARADHADGAGAEREAAITTIRRLLAAGRADEARERLQDFRRRWPDAVLPPDLAALAAAP